MWVGNRFGAEARPFGGETEGVGSVALSPDGRYVAYASGTPGRDSRGFIDRFPDGGGRVSIGEAQGPRWNADGTRFFYGLADATPSLWSAGFDSETGDFSSQPVHVVDIGILVASRNYGLMPDGGLVVAQSEARSADDDRILLISNWTQLLDPAR